MTNFINNTKKREVAIFLRNYFIYFQSTKYNMTFACSYLLQILFYKYFFFSKKEVIKYRVKFILIVV